MLEVWNQPTMPVWISSASWPASTASRRMRRSRSTNSDSGSGGGAANSKSGLKSASKDSIEGRDEAVVFMGDS